MKDVVARVADDQQKLEVKVYTEHGWFFGFWRNQGAEDWKPLKKPYKTTLGAIRGGYYEAKGLK